MHLSKGTKSANVQKAVEKIGPDIKTIAQCAVKNIV